MSDLHAGAAMHGPAECSLLSLPQDRMSKTRAASRPSTREFRDSDVFFFLAVGFVAIALAVTIVVVRY